MDPQKRFVAQFKEQTDSLLLQLQQGLIRLDRDPQNPELLNDIFRNMHTTKGNANMLGYRSIGLIAHEVESIFMAMRDGELDYATAASELSEVLFEAIDTIQTMVDAVGRDEELQLDIVPLIQRLQKFSNDFSEPKTSFYEPPTVLKAPVSTPKPNQVKRPLDSFQQKQLATFKENADAQLLQLQQALVRLERDATNSELLRDIFRTAHTLKGDANIMGFRDLGKIAHEMENIFAAMRDGELDYEADPTGLIAEALFEALEVIQTMVSEIGAVEAEEPDITPLLSRLRAVTQPAILLDPAVEAVSSVPTVSATHRQAATSAVTGQSLPLFDDVIRVSVEKLDTLMNISGELMLDKMQTESTLRNLRTLQDLLRQRQRISQPVRNLLATTDRDPSEVTTLVDIRVNLQQIQQFDQQIEALIKNTFKEYEDHSSHLQATIDELESSVLEMRMLPLQTLFDNLPFRVRVLSSQTTDVKANIIVKANIEMSGGEIELDKKVLEEIVAPLDHIIRNSFAHGFQPEPAIVRKAAGKPETATIKITANSESGFVIIKISDDGIGIDPEVLRQKAVEKGILTKPKADATPDDEILNIIFESRFSTRLIIDELAGRGVGMDVVKNNVERLNGQVTVNSQKGQGTTITLKVPLTFAISRALMVRINQELYAIPAPAIQEMRYLTTDEVLSREGRDIVVHASTVVPLVRLSDILGGNKNINHPLFRYLQTESGRLSLANLPTGIMVQPVSERAFGNGSNTNGKSLVSPFAGLVLADPQAQARIQSMQVANEGRAVRQLTYERIPAVVVGTGDRKVCFIVDELVDETEIVLKSLNPVLATAEYVSGATIMGDGRVVLILDVPSLINAAKSGSKTVQGRGRTRDTLAPRKRILVVDDSITTRELEKSILEAQGYEVELADDGTVALEKLRVANRYDLVVSDVEMPRMDGFELTKNIKSDPNFRSLPVIIVSSLNSEANKRRGIEAGAQAYIEKGQFNQSNLLNVIEYLTS